MRENAISARLPAFMPRSSTEQDHERVAADEHAGGAEGRRGPGEHDEPDPGRPSGPVLPLTGSSTRSGRRSPSVPAGYARVVPGRGSGVPPVRRAADRPPPRGRRGQVIPADLLLGRDGGAPRNDRAYVLRRAADYPPRPRKNRTLEAAAARLRGRPGPAPRGPPRVERRHARADQRERDLHKQAQARTPDRACHSARSSRESARRRRRCSDDEHVQHHQRRPRTPRPERTAELRPQQQNRTASEIRVGDEGEDAEERFRMSRLRGAAEGSEGCQEEHDLLKHLVGSLRLESDS